MIQALTNNLVKNSTYLPVRDDTSVLQLFVAQGTHRKFATQSPSESWPGVKRDCREWRIARGEIRVKIPQVYRL